MTSSFLEKLKRGMGADGPAEEPKPEAKQPKKQAKKKIQEKTEPVKEKPIEANPPENKKIEVKKEENEVKRVSVAKTEEGWPEPEGQLTIDVYQTNGEIVIQSAVGGIKPEDLDISIENDAVSIKGERKKTFEKEDVNYFYQECYWGRFSREIILPAEVDAKRAKATMKDGILIIRMPKIEKDKKRKVDIKEE